MQTIPTLLPPKAQSALLSCTTAEEAEKYVRDFVSERLLILGTVLAVPGLGLSLSRAFHGPWFALYTIHCLIVATFCLAVLTRRSIPGGVKGLVLPFGVLSYGLVETYYFGLATGGPVFAIFVPAMTLPILGLARTLGLLTGIGAILMLLGARAVFYPELLAPAIAEVSQSPWTWLIAMGSAAALSVLSLVALGTLMAALSFWRTSYDAQSRQFDSDRARFELAMQGTDDGLWDWDMRTGEIYRSDRWFRMLGYQRGDFADTLETFDALIHPDDLSRVHTAASEEVAGLGEIIESEFRLRHRDGSWVPILSRAFVVRENGEAVRIVGTHIDLSERERLTADLRRIESMLSDGIEALPLGLAFFDRSGHLVISNQKYGTLLEMDADDVRLSANFEDLVRAHASLARGQCGYATDEAWTSARLEATRGGGTWAYQLASGRSVEIYECPTSRGGFLSVVADVTEARRRQEELNQALKMEAVGKLTGGIAHDFNNLLAVIRGNADVLSYSAPDLTAEISAISAAAQRGAELTERLLAFSRQQPLRPRGVSPQRLIDDLSPILERTLGEAHHVSFDAPDNIWNILVDPGQLENAVLNLAINARDAMPRGGSIEVTARNVSVPGEPVDCDLADGDYVEIAVRDFGAGMSEDTLRQAFDPFFTTKEVGQGNGLGLAMVHGFALQSGGGAAIESELGQGTTVRLFLRRARRTAPVEARHPSQSDLPMGTGQSILVIEDDSSVRAMTSRMLETLGYSVTTAEDGPSAEAVLASDACFDLVLSDIVLPGGRLGPEVIRDVRATRTDFSVIFMSGYSPDAAPELRELVDASLLLKKPFSLNQLATAVSQTIGLEPADSPATDGQNGDVETTPLPETGSRTAETAAEA